MIIKEYTVIIRVHAETNDDFPSINGLVNGLNDGLPDDWFSMTEGDDFYIDGWEYKEVNNPKWISHDTPTTWDEVQAAAELLTNLWDQP